MPETRTLHCALGDHSWERPAQRGRVPANCPDHQPVPRAVAVKVAAGSHTGDALQSELSPSARADALYLRMTSLANRERSVIEHITVGLRVKR